MLDNLRRQMIQAEAGGGTAHIVKGFFRKFGVLKGTRIVGTADKLREEQEKLMQGTALFLKDIRIAADNAKGTSDELPLKQLVNELAEANLGIELSVQQASGNINKVLTRYQKENGNWDLYFKHLLSKKKSGLTSLELIKSFGI